MGTKLFFRLKTIFANNVLGLYIFSIILEFRNLKFKELENWELEVPGTWELWNLGTSELGNLFKGIPPRCLQNCSCYTIIKKNPQWIEMN